jgi:cell division septum initiation protein DivIVA
MFALNPVRSSKAFFPLLNLKRVDFEQIIFSSSQKVIQASIRNVQRLLEEAKEAHRLMAQNERRSNTYQILHLRHRPETNREPIPIFQKHAF